jgi:hypothetical protein
MKTIFGTESSTQPREIHSSKIVALFNQAENALNDQEEEGLIQKDFLKSLASPNKVTSTKK